MVNNAAIVSVVDKITKKNSPPCKKTLQKMVFLIEAKKIDLGCEYGIHFYGPYSADLDYAVRELSDDGVLNIEYTEMDHLISVVNHDAYNEYSNTQIDKIIDEFGGKTASELELIATALYVYLETKDINQIKAGVKKIKGHKYSDSRIDEAIELLNKSEYFVA